MSPQTDYPNKASSVDELFDTLSHSLRREVIHYFETCEKSEETHLTEVVNHIDKRVPEPISKIRRQLYHVHLPKLDDKNWLTYSAETGNIQYHGHEKADYLIGEVYDMF